PRSRAKRSRSRRARAPRGRSWPARRASSAGEVHGGPVGEDLGDARGELGGVVAHADDGVRAHLLRVLQHVDVRLVPRRFADLRVLGDVAADDLLQAASIFSENAFVFGFSQKMTRGMRTGMQHALVPLMPMSTMWNVHAHGRFGKKGAA